MDPLSAGIVGIAALIVILFSGMPIGIVMGLVGFLGMAYIGGTGAAFTSMGSSPYTTASSYGLSVVPLFVLMGSFCFFSGLSRDLYNTAYKWLGHFPGGLAMATVGGCAGFAAVSGSSVATTATMGMVALPEMRRYKYDQLLATGCIAAGGSIGILIPPSIILVIYGILTEQSIGKLFLAGFMPGILEAIFYMITIYILCTMNPLLGPRGEKSSFKQRLVSLKDTWGVLTLFIIVIGGIYMGIFTPTEAAGVGAFGALLFALGMSVLGKRQFTWQNFMDSLIDTGKTTAMVFVILIGANILGYFLAITRLPFALSDYVAALAVNRYIVLGIVIIVYLFLGAIMSSMAMIVLTVPILFPVITALGFDPIWFGIIIVRLVEIGQITPPVGINVFIMQGIAKDVPMYDIFRGIVPFLIADIVHVAMLIAFPQIALFLPNLMK
ncbi:MAG: C4-dicarboxylate ABC transporter permease [Deltaproteobacteria bacterium RBG_13_53_10]|nr:MAG: C4-dicarboxylate ABC transporter permease [Deltaproteobacteria bacterium RBG_13_53_10]